MEEVAAQRRALSPRGYVKEDYIFELAADGKKVKLLELFTPGLDSLVIYNIMFPRWAQDRCVVVPGGRTAELPLIK